MQRHKDVAGEWHNLCAKALKPNAVPDEPNIPIYQNTNGNNANAPKQPTELRSDVVVNGFWRQGTISIFDIRITDTDAPSNKTKDPGKILRTQEKEKKNRYGEACKEAHRHFTPLVYSVDGMEGTEAKAARKRLASILAVKWNRNYSQVCGFVHSRLAVALVRATSKCLRGSRKPTRRPIDWVTGAGSRLLR